MTKKIILIFLSFILVTALIFTGCTPARRIYDNTNQDNNLNQNNGQGNNVNYREDGINYGTNYGTNVGTNSRTNGLTNNNLANNNMGNYMNTNNNTLNADKVATAVKQVKGVKNATVVVTGNTAYVGVSLDNNATTVNQRDIKKEIAQRVKTTFNEINTVYISTEVGFGDRLRNIGEGIRGGRPIDAFTTELNEMVKRITPASL